MPDTLTTVFCPRCDRAYSSLKPAKAWAVLKKHVTEQHPDHDPNWADE